MPKADATKFLGPIKENSNFLGSITAKLIYTSIPFINKFGHPPKTELVY